MMVTPLPASTRNTPEDTFVTVNGLWLHYLDWGGSPTSPLLCLYGVTGNAHLWDAFAKAVQTDFRVYALDQRGHGESQWPVAPEYRTADWVADLLGVLDALSVGRMVLVGQSMGAHNAMAFAARHPNRVRSLVWSIWGRACGGACRTG